MPESFTNVLYKNIKDGVFLLEDFAVVAKKDRMAL
jgi:hypothetical protein